MIPNFITPLIARYRFQKAIKPFKDAEKEACKRTDTQAIHRTRKATREAVQSDLRASVGR
jgi:hypothetical protein